MKNTLIVFTLTALFATYGSSLAVGEGSGDGDPRLPACVGPKPAGKLEGRWHPARHSAQRQLTVAGIYEIYTGKKCATPNILNGGEYRELTTALKTEDVNRRLKEAEAFIHEHQDATTSKAPQK